MSHPRPSGPSLALFTMAGEFKKNLSESFFPSHEQDYILATYAYGETIKLVFRGGRWVAIDGHHNLRRDAESCVAKYLKPPVPALAKMRENLLFEMLAVNHDHREVRIRCRMTAVAERLIADDYLRQSVATREALIVEEKEKLAESVMDTVYGPIRAALIRARTALRAMGIPACPVGELSEIQQTATNVIAEIDAILESIT